MKKLLQISILFLLIHNCSAQTWAAPGATWYYDVAPNFYSVGYVKITRTGDTLIQGHMCDILEKRATGFNIAGPFPMYFDNVYSYEYTYTNNNVVYHWRTNAFYVLYDFNASPGSGWTVAGSPFGLGVCDSTGYVTCIQSGNTIINGQPLMYSDVVSDSLSVYGFSDSTSRILQKIGNTSSFNADFLTCIADANEMYKLRCYSDSSGFYYSTGIAPGCNFITGIYDTSVTNLISFSPNPFTNELTVSIPQLNTEAQLTLLDVYGKQVLTQIIPPKTLYLKLQTLNLVKGVYFLQLQRGNQNVTRKVIKM